MALRPSPNTRLFAHTLAAPPRPPTVCASQILTSPPECGGSSFQDRFNAIKGGAQAERKQRQQVVTEATDSIQAFSPQFMKYFSPGNVKGALESSR